MFGWVGQENGSVFAAASTAAAEPAATQSRRVVCCGRYRREAADRVAHRPKAVRPKTQRRRTLRSPTLQILQRHKPSKTTAQNLILRFVAHSMDACSSCCRILDKVRLGGYNRTADMV